MLETKPDDNTHVVTLESATTWHIHVPQYLNSQQSTQHHTKRLQKLGIVIPEGRVVDPKKSISSAASGVVSTQATRTSWCWARAHTSKATTAALCRMQLVTHTQC